jgi:hypothetical protein
VVIAADPYGRNLGISRPNQIIDKEFKTDVKLTPVLDKVIFLS